MPDRYLTYEEALRRVNVLKRSGCWPGIVGPFADGSWTLTRDPGDLEMTR